MTIFKSFGQIKRNWIVLLYPILVDVVSLIAGLSAVGFSGQSGWSLRLILEMGIPSVGHLLNTPLFANRTELLSHPAGLPSFFWIVVLLLLLATAFAQGGYIGSLLQIAQGERTGFSRFLAYGRAYFLRFFMFYALFFFAKIALTALLAILFGYVGVFTAFLTFFILRIAYIYVEFTIVADRANLGEAFKTSWGYLKSSLPETALVAAAMFLFSGAVSLLLHLYWNLGVIVLGILVYAYVMSCIQLALMLIMTKARTEFKA